MGRRFMCEQEEWELVESFPGGGMVVIGEPGEPVPVGRPVTIYVAQRVGGGGEREGISLSRETDVETVSEARLCKQVKSALRDLQGP